jgi:hypothetical protein
MVLKQYSPTEQEFIFQWVDRWFRLGKLIFKLMCFDSTPSPPPPTEMDENSFLELRSWFIDNEDKFVKIWIDYYESHDKALHLGGDEPGIITTSHKCLLNPFSLYYSPENLYHLVKELDIQSETEIWDPSEHRAWTAVIDMLQMDGRVVEFFKWVEERT